MNVLVVNQQESVFTPLNIEIIKTQIQRKTSAPNVIIKQKEMSKILIKRRYIMEDDSKSK